MKDKQFLESLGFEDVIVYDDPSYDGALVGVTLDNQAVYDYDQMIKYLVTQNGMDEDEAADFINYNYSYNSRFDLPIIMVNLNEWRDTE